MQVYNSKDDYFKAVSKKLNVSLDDVYAMYYGEVAVSDSNIARRITTEFVTEGAVMFVVVIWKGNPLAENLTNNLYYDYMGQVIEGMNLALFRKGYHVQLFVLNRWMLNDAYFERLISKRPNAGFLAIGGHHVKNLQRVCQASNRPYFLLTYPSNAEKDDRYIPLIDNTKISEIQVAHIAELGHRRIAYIHGVLKMETGLKRLDSFKQAMNKHQIPINPQLVGGATWQADDGYKTTLKFMAQEPKPTAIICANDLLASGAIKAVNSLGLNVPRDVSIIGCDNTPVAMAVTPRLTTVQIPATKMGRIATKMLISELEGIPLEDENTQLDVELIIRDTTAPIAP